MHSCFYAFLQYDKCLQKYPKNREKCDWIYHYMRACHLYKT